MLRVSDRATIEEKKVNLIRLKRIGLRYPDSCFQDSLDSFVRLGSNSLRKI